MDLDFFMMCSGGFGVICGGYNGFALISGGLWFVSRGLQWVLVVSGVFQ